MGLIERRPQPVARAGALPLPSSPAAAPRRRHRVGRRWMAGRCVALAVVVVVVVSGVWGAGAALLLLLRRPSPAALVVRSWPYSAPSPPALARAQTPASSYAALVDPADGALLPPPAAGSTASVLILCPMRNAIEHIWHFFYLLDRLTYPRHLIHLALLVSDSDDRTYLRAQELARERQRPSFWRRTAPARYARISVFHHDFAPPTNDDVDDGDDDDGSGANIGPERHAYAAQLPRRTRLAKSRSWLLSAALTPEIDYVLWLDVDLVDYEPQLIERLLRFSTGDPTPADAVVPNCVWKTYNEMGAYDRNNWIETPESLAYKATLAPTDVLIEGYPDHPTYRFNLASLVPTDPARHLSPYSPYHAHTALLLSDVLPSSAGAEELPLPLPPQLLHASDGRAVVPRTVDLDGVGGCAVLARAEVHREGAIFPAWPPVDHQLETEGFAQLVKALRRRRRRRLRRRPQQEGGTEDQEGEEVVEPDEEEEETVMGKNGEGRLLGLPGYYVYHGLYG